MKTRINPKVHIELVAFCKRFNIPIMKKRRYRDIERVMKEHDDVVRLHTHGCGGYSNPNSKWQH